MARFALTLRKSRFDAGRRLVARTSALLGSSAGVLDRALKRGLLAGPLLLVLRAANKLAQSLLDHPAAPPTPAQRRALQAAGAQIRLMASSILASERAHDADSVEHELIELISRTLTLIEHVTQQPPEPLLITQQSPGRLVIETTGTSLEPESAPKP